MVDGERRDAGRRRAAASPPPSVDELPPGSPLFAGLSDRSSRRLLARARVTHHGPHRVLSLRGAYPGGCWLLLEGHVKEHRRLPDGGEVITDVRGPGDLVAEESAIERVPAVVDVTTIDDVTALFFDARRLERLADTDPEIAVALLHAVSLRVLSAQVIAVRNGHQDLEHRVSLALLDLEHRFGREVPTGRCLGVPLSQADLASWAGMSRESLAKVLRRLRARGLVITSRCDIVLPDVDALRRRLWPHPPSPATAAAAVLEPAR